MNEYDRNLQIINRINLFFIIAGFIEVFYLVSLTHIIYLGLVGLITIIPSYLARESSSLKQNYFPGGWAILKYNPIVLILLYFVISDLSFDLFDSTIYVIYGIGILLLALASFMLGIVLIVKSVKLQRIEKQKDKTK